MVALTKSGAAAHTRQLLRRSNAAVPVQPTFSSRCHTQHFECRDSSCVEGRMAAEGTLVESKRGVGDSNHPSAATFVQ